MKAIATSMAAILSQSDPEITPVTVVDKWYFFGLGLIVGGSIEAASHFQGNACLSEISSISADIYMVFYLNKDKELSEFEFVTMETAPYVSSILTKFLEWECGMEYASEIVEIVDSINTLDPAPTARLRKSILRQDTTTEGE